MNRLIYLFFIKKCVFSILMGMTKASLKATKTVK